jgi:DNA-binding response OmpR family regulator
MRILIVEDDELLGEGLVTALKRQDHAVDWLRDGVSASAALASEEFDLVLLDLGLPRQDGLGVLAKLRAAGQRVPVLILTARDQVGDKVKGLDLGADDYLVKPFELPELLARVRALGRRARGQARNQIVHGEIVLDPAAYQCTWQGRTIDLPRKEFTLLRVLIENAGRVLTREAVVQKIYGWEEDPESNAL